MISVAIVVVAIDGGGAIGDARINSRDTEGLTAAISSRFAATSVRMADGVHFMHASSPRNYGKVVLDSRLSDYLARYKTDAGILVARPLK